MDPGLYHHINQHGADVHQGMNDDKIWQKRRAEFQYQPGEEGEGQEHPEAPEQVTTVKNERQEHVLRGKEEGGDQPGKPATLQLLF